jgi:immune inhibitor A
VKLPTSFFLATAAVLVAGLLAPAWTMPLHPDLLARMREGKTVGPVFPENDRELQSRGVNVPNLVRSIHDITSGRSKENFQAIAILLDFSDNVAQVQPAFFDTLLYEDQWGTLRDYWYEVTYGNLTITTLDLPGALGWKRAPQTYAYYVDGQRGFGSYPHNAQKMAEDAVVLADPFVDFSQYDNDGDGYVDGLFIIHAGRGYELTGNPDHIHSHKWQMHTPQSVDGVTAYVYSTEPEYWTTPGDMTCGVYAHEMGHSVFGLPDLYDYGYDSNGLGKWSLMAGGSWNGPLGSPGGSYPAHPDAWCRIQTGAASATILPDNLLGATIPAINTTPVIYRLWTDGAGGTQFFLLENRRKMGYDSYIPGEGLLIYHVDETQSGNNHQWYPGHTDFGNYLVALEQADGRWWLEKQMNSGDYKDPYPGGSDARTFANLTTPDSRDYDFNSTKVMVTNISDSDSVMTADLFVTDIAPPEAVVDLAAVLSHSSAKSASGDVCLEWSEPFAEAGVSHYVIYRSADPAEMGDSLDVSSGTVYIDANIVGDTGVNCYYCIRVVDNAGTPSPLSNQAGEFDILMENGVK